MPKEKKSIEKSSIEILIKNKYGIHARPSAMFVKIASKYQSNITVEKDDIKIPAKDILALMTLEARCGTKIKITAEGEDSQEALNDLQELINNKFGFEE
jgi:phosphocarrier protein